MNSRWQEELLALVTRYGEACAQLAAERESGRREHPAADRTGAWRAILSHLALDRDGRMRALTDGATGS